MLISEQLSSSSSKVSSSESNLMCPEPKIKLYELKKLTVHENNYVVVRVFL